MKFLQLLVYKLLARAIDTVNRYFDIRRLHYMREVLEVSIGILAHQIHYRSEAMAKRKAIYSFRPFEVSDVDYRSAATNIGTIGAGRQYPKARSGHRIVCSDATIYCFGGFNPNNSLVRDGNNDEREELCLFQELWKYDMVRKEWTLLLDSNNDLPIELASNAMLLYGDMIMVFGGTGYPFGVHCSNKLHVCLPGQRSKDLVKVEVTGDLPPPQYGQAIIINDNFLYTIGGTNGFDYSLDVHRLHLPSKTWECAYECKQNIRDDPSGRYRHELAYDDYKIYVIGGGTSDSVFILTNIPAYDMKANKWEYLATKPDPLANLPGIPSARKCHSCVQIRTDQGLEVVVAGGYDGISYFRDIWKLNLSTLQWKKMQKSNLPYPLFFHDAAVTSDGCMHIFGGIKFSNNTTVRTNTLYKMWTTIPRLSVIAWEAMLHYIPNMHNRTKEELLEAGIPRQFVERVHG
ncbi:kelch domain-containing protein 10 homolog [Anopheles nili]|uniref:kelch domain-containing protein 10 homolog n=1 Tax=Anopheles nili TaxID=185578 RepID=UPI00237A3E1B|nr:kelch domain-containing protein 10 homolog [Anopheles nili]